MVAPSAPRLLVFMNGRNCGRYVQDAIRSVARQDWPHKHVLYVDDASDDGSADLALATLQSEMPGQHHLIRNAQPQGKAHNTSVHLRELAPMFDAVAIVDADDQLIEPTILSQLADAYTHKRDVVWTNYITDTGRTGGNGPLDATLSPRAQPWLSSHLFSFRACLLDFVPESYFKDADGHWLQAACDMAIAYPMLDLTRRYLYLPVEAYRYTASNPLSHHNLAQEPEALSSPLQRVCAGIVLDKPALQRMDLQITSPRPSQVKPLTSHEAHASAWDAACAFQVAQGAPDLLMRTPAEHISTLDPLFLLSWWQHLANRPGQHLLCLGDDAHIQALACLAQAADCRVTMLRGEVNPQEGDPQIAPWAEYELDGDVAYLPDLTHLPAQATFDAVCIAANAWGAQRQPLVALTALASRLSLSGFQVAMLGLGSLTLRESADRIMAALPEIAVSEVRSAVPTLWVKYAPSAIHQPVMPSPTEVAATALAN